jgi:hypothetical protein
MFIIHFWDISEFFDIVGRVADKSFEFRMRQENLFVICLRASQIFDFLAIAFMILILSTLVMRKTKYWRY